MVQRIRAVFAAHPRAEWLIPLACCLILLTQVLFSVRQMSQHADEATHLYAGYRVLKCGDYTYGREHPPLAKMLVALPLLASNPPMDCIRGTAGFDEEDQSTKWLYSQENWWHLLMEARIVSSLSAVALCLGVWIVARRMFGLAVAVVSTVALAFEPNILGHGALLLNDILLSALFLFTVFSFYLWTRQRSVPLLFGTGLLTGLALLTKHSAVVLAPMLILLAVAEAWLEKSNRKEAARRALGNLGAAVAIGVIAAATIWLVYGLRYSGGTRETAMPLEVMNSAEVRFLQAVRTAHLLPPDYIEGLIEVRGLVDTTGDGNYFLGRPFARSPWYCFPVTVAIKFTLPLLAMLAMGGAGLMLMGRERRTELVFMLAPGLLYFGASLRVPRFSGIWHLFPMVPFLMIAMAAGCVCAARRYRWVTGLLVCLLVLHAASSLRAYPNYLSYANEAWGGPQNLYKYLPMTDVGQTFWEIGRYMEQHPDTPCWVSGEWPVPVGPYKVPCKRMGNYFGTPLPARMNGIVFISSSWLALFGQPGGPYAPFYESQPKARLGGSAMMVYEGEFDTRVAAARALDNQAKTLVLERQCAAAMLPAEEAVEMSPSTASAHYMYGVALLYNGRPDLALGECTTALKEVLPDMVGQRVAKDIAQNCTELRNQGERDSHAGAGATVN
ncbi:MAG: glycosyltransferase family 39 protein [Candidatus Korobacteraceae bacterium]